MILRSLITCACFAGCVIAAAPVRPISHPNVPDETGVFAVDFSARGTGFAQLIVAADDVFTARIDGQRLPIQRFRNRYGIENYSRPAIYEVGRLLTPGPHHLELVVTNIGAYGASWQANPGGVTFAIDERDGAGVMRIASSAAGVTVNGHAAFVVPTNPAGLWTREVGEPWLWLHPALIIRPRH